MKKLIFTIAMVVIAAANLTAQDGVAINATGAAADPSAMLDVSSSNKGILIPRLTQAERLSITGPARGLMVYQIDNNEGFWYYNGTTWLQFGDNLGNHTAADSLNMTNNKIVNLATCTQNLDAANKEYVDNAVSAGGGGSSLADTTYMLCGSKLLPVAYGGTSYTVPAGKMWSIESAVYTHYRRPVAITSINGLTYGFAYIVNYSLYDTYYGYYVYCIATPYFLPAGTTVTFNVGDSSYPSERGLVSIKEYKMVIQ